MLIFKLENELIKTSENYLYIDIDDCFTTLENNHNKKTKYRIRIAQVRTKTKFHEVQNKRVMISMYKIGTSVNTENYTYKLIQFIKNNYANYEEKNYNLWRWW